MIFISELGNTRETFAAPITKKKKKKRISSWKLQFQKNNCICIEEETM